MNTYTKEEWLKKGYTEFQLERNQKWSTTYPSFPLRGNVACVCLQWLWPTVKDKRAKAYKDCSNCFGYGYPPIPWTELNK